MPSYTRWTMLRAFSAFWRVRSSLAAYVQEIRESRQQLVDGVALLDAADSASR